MRPQHFTRRDFLKSTGAAAASLAIAGCESELGSEGKGCRAVPMVPFETVDIDVGEERQVVLGDGGETAVKLLKVEETCDSVCGAVRQAKVYLRIDGKGRQVFCGNYHLPRVFGNIKVDCPIVKSYYGNTNRDRWGLRKDARLRLWPGHWPLLKPGTFAYPLRQRWFASETQMANEPTHVDGGERTERSRVYYHSALDFGGAEGLAEVVSATDGLVVSVGKDALAGYGGRGVQPRGDVVYVVDERQWHYRYSHLYSIAEGLKPGDKIKMGQRIGLLGKEGASGGWSHLHFGINSLWPNGKWGTQEGYAFVWEAYINEFKPAVIAVARPHIVAKVGEKVVLDGGKSWCCGGGRLRFEWTLSDGTIVKKEKANTVYGKTGTYSEVLKVSDSAGNVGYDFCTVQIFEPAKLEEPPPSIHACYWPTFDLKPGEPITFKVRSFDKERIGERWDFGDGSGVVKVVSDGNIETLNPDGYAVTRHTYKEAGDYLVRVDCKNKRGHTGTCHLHVRIG